jgi:pimeloyl-ACP methyl ester carboxylesterase
MYEKAITKAQGMLEQDAAAGARISARQSTTARRGHRTGQALAVMVLFALALVWGDRANANPRDLLGGASAFQDFNVNAEGYSAGNAYLGALLVTLMYPDNLAWLTHPYEPVARDPRATASDKTRKDRQRAALATTLHHDFNQFMAKYQEATRHLFGRQQVQYEGVNTCIRNNLETYDYEAVLISTSSAVLVVIRGTDRVDCSGSGAEYEFSEWLGTDFVFWQEPPVIRNPRTNADVAIGGQGALVHRGFWQSTVVANQNSQSANIVDKVRRLSNSGAKKIWIMGHSLGAAHAQTLAILFRASNLRPQGVYAYAAPHVGNPALVEWMNQQIGKNRIQRFEFKIDPVTILPTYTLVDPTNRLRRQTWARAGVRNYFADIRTLERAKAERMPVEDVNPILSMPQGVGRGVENKLVTSVQLDAVWPQTPGIVPFCYHHPQWLLHATYNQLSQSVRDRMPRPGALGTPTASRDWLACNQMTVDWGMQKNVVDDGAALAQAAVSAGAQAIQNVAFNVGQLFENLSGTAVAEGLYYIRAYQYPDRYLAERSSCAGQNGCTLVLSNRKTAFWVRRSAATYHIERQIGQTWQRVDLAAEQLGTEGGKVQLWGRALGPNQTWMFFRTPNNGPFLIRNNAGIGNKVIDMRNCTAGSTNCAVRSFNGVTNSQHQLWVLERAN